MSFDMFGKYLLFSLTLTIFHSVGAELFDSFEFLSSLDLQLDEELLRVRRDANSSTLSEDEIWTKVLKIWANVIESTSKIINCNISIIGWENVYDASGNIVEVNSIELAFPVRKDSEGSNFMRSHLNNIHNRSEQHEVIRNCQVDNRVSAQGVLVDFFIEGRDEQTDDSPTLLHWTPDSTYFRVNGLVTYNKTQVATKEEVQKFIEEISSRNKSLLLKPLVLVRRDNTDLSNIELTLWDSSVYTYVVESWEASDELLLASPTILLEVMVLSEKEEIPEKLAQRFNQKFPEYDWRVLVNPGELYLVRDVWIKLSTDGFEFYEGEKDIYFIYGIKI